MKQRAIGVCVDSGCIFIGDSSILEFECEEIRYIPISNGRYEVEVSINNTWNGDTKETIIVDIKSEMLVAMRSFQRSLTMWDVRKGISSRSSIVFISLGSSPFPSKSSR